MKPPHQLITRAQCRCGDAVKPCQQGANAADTCLYLWGARERVARTCCRLPAIAWQRVVAWAMYLPLADVLGPTVLICWKGMEHSTCCA